MLSYLKSHIIYFLRHKTLSKEILNDCNVWCDRYHLRKKCILWIVTKPNESVGGFFKILFLKYKRTQLNKIKELGLIQSQENVQSFKKTKLFQKSRFYARKRRTTVSKFCKLYTLTQDSKYWFWNLEERIKVNSDRYSINITSLSIT